MISALASESVVIRCVLVEFFPTEIDILSRSHTQEQHGKLRDR